MTIDISEVETYGSNPIEEKLEGLINKYKSYYQYGQVANYIPALSKAEPKDIGITLCDITGNYFYAGKTYKKFTIQSISKIVTLALALMDHGEEFVFDKVGVEPTGDAFNSIVKLETTKPGKPSNPMINAGAIAVTSMIKGENKKHKFERIMDLIRKLSKDEMMSMDQRVYQSESATGNKNRALAYYMKDLKIIDGNVEDIVDLYFRQCSILVDCKDLANIAAVFANDGICPNTAEVIIPKRISKIVKAIMLTCGMYDESGKFALQVGLPAKSGVGGGIIAVVPEKMGIGVYGPALDGKGNSIVGMKILEDLSKALHLSIF